VYILIIYVYTTMPAPALHKLLHANCKLLAARARGLAPLALHSAARRPLALGAWSRPPALSAPLYLLAILAAPAAAVTAVSCQLCAALMLAAPGTALPPTPRPAPLALALALGPCAPLTTPARPGPGAPAPAPAPPAPARAARDVPQMQMLHTPRRYALCTDTDMAYDAR
jgi:hypothetical protein